MALSGHDRLKKPAARRFLQGKLPGRQGRRALENGSEGLVDADELMQLLVPGFHDDRDALTAADTGRSQTVATAATLEFVKDGQSQSSA